MKSPVTFTEPFGGIVTSNNSFIGYPIDESDGHALLVVAISNAPTVTARIGVDDELASNRTLLWGRSEAYGALTSTTCTSIRRSMDEEGPE